MATTKSKESCGLGKERKITATGSHTVPNTPTKRTPKSSPRATSSDQKLTHSSSFTSLSTLAEKHVPNYLKSTASSRHEHGHGFKPSKKSAGPAASTSAGPAPIPEAKASLNRRRSFDKPPPTAPRLDKPFRSPGPRDRANHVPVRSSSFGAKSTTTTIVSSAKPGFLDRSNSKISKVGGKAHQPVLLLKTSSNVKKSLKRESSNATSASAEMVHKTKNVVEHVVDQGPPFVLGVNEEDLKKIECELDPYLPDPMPELDKELRTDQVEKKAVLDKEEADRKKEAEKKLHHQQQPIQDTEIFKVVVSNKEVEETPVETEISTEAAAKSQIRVEENRERNEGEGEEGAQEEEKPERIAVEKEEVVADVASEESTNNKNEEKTVTEEKSEIDPVHEGVVVLDQKEAQDGQRSCKEETTEKEADETEKVTIAAAAAAAAAEKEAEVVAAAAGKLRQGGAARKESAAMYNHVIEETASKLLEKRKNKVRALAGAFQTVIDYESSSK